MRLTDEALAAIEKRAEAATHPPPTTAAIDSPRSASPTRTPVFIAAARSDVPALLAEIRELRRERDEAHAAGMEHARQIVQAYVSRSGDERDQLLTEGAHRAGLAIRDAVEAVRAAGLAGGKWRP